ncbi:23S rRNA (pseudouridine(1915)-N(3))-methyltransferase RlmH [bacterium]|nr:23S rRNA (pseudouridine(1915)-N(3))-methyltransferase RlmH [bacterium]
MQITFVLCWGTKKVERQFHFSSCLELFLEYTSRLRKFIPCNVKVTTPEAFAPLPTDVNWCCHGHKGAMLPSSEELSAKVEMLMGSGVKNLNILIGPSDGFDETFLKRLHMTTWSFGPLTLPHELAAVLASEQIYRALSIINRHPYHLGHN